MPSQGPTSLSAFRLSAASRTLGDRINGDTTLQNRRGFKGQYVSDDLYVAPNDEIVSYLCQMARLFHSPYRDELVSLAQAVGLPKSSVIMGNVKAEGLALNKAETDYKGDPMQVKDYLRATIACDNPDQIFEVLDILRNDSRVVELTDKFSKPEKKRDWRGAIAIVHIADGFYAELQIHHKAMLPVYEKTHALYEDARACQRRRLEIDQYFERCQREGIQVDANEAINKALAIEQLSDVEKGLYASIKSQHTSAATACGLNELIVGGEPRSDFANAATGMPAVKPEFRRTRFGSRKHNRREALTPRGHS